MICTRGSWAQTSADRKRARRLNLICGEYLVLLFHLSFPTHVTIFHPSNWILFPFCSASDVSSWYETKTSESSFTTIFFFFFRVKLGLPSVTSRLLWRFCAVSFFSSRWGMESLIHISSPSVLITSIPGNCLTIHAAVSSLSNKHSVQHLAYECPKNSNDQQRRYLFPLFWPRITKITTWQNDSSHIWESDEQSVTEWSRQKITHSVTLMQASIFFRIRIERHDLKG